MCRERERCENKNGMKRIENNSFGLSIHYGDYILNDELSKKHARKDNGRFSMIFFCSFHFEHIFLGRILFF